MWSSSCWYSLHSPTRADLQCEYLYTRAVILMYIQWIWHIRMKNWNILVSFLQLFSQNYGIWVLIGLIMTKRTVEIFLDCFECTIRQCPLPCSFSLTGHAHPALAIETFFVLFMKTTCHSLLTHTHSTHPPPGDESIRDLLYYGRIFLHGHRYHNLCMLTEREKKANYSGATIFMCQHQLCVWVQWQHPILPQHLSAILISTFSSQLLICLSKRYLNFDLFDCIFKARINSNGLASYMFFPVHVHVLRSPYFQYLPSFINEQEKKKLCTPSRTGTPKWTQPKLNTI